MTTISKILDLAAIKRSDLPASARKMAQFSLFDWMVCGCAGAREPLAGILRKLAADEGGALIASIIGAGRAPARVAALVNGATSHALDYDDTHFAHVGHPSVAIYPAALAAGEEVLASAEDVVDAFLVGAEASIRIGLVLGSVHYNRGFHQTATAGAFGATVAAGRIFGLSRDQMRVALGLCATRASGLKSQFGTMGKPYNAGIAASNGIECATLAKLGFTSADDGLEGPQGFIPTHSDNPDAASAWVKPLPENFLFEDVKFKMHACCHGTHAMIEALLAEKQLSDLSTSSVSHLELRTSPRWLSVCDIAKPRTGLEVKFSYRWLAGMVLDDFATSDDSQYSDTLAVHSGLEAFAEKVTVLGDKSLNDMQANLVLTMKNGSKRILSHDLSVRFDDKIIEDRLRQKARHLIGNRADTIWQKTSAPQSLSARDIGELLRGE